MFDNIGKKIKILAYVLTWVGIIASVITGIAMMNSFDSIVRTIGLIVLIVGSLLSWASSFIIYGFGQLIENTDIIAGRNKSSDSKNVSSNQQNGGTISVKPSATNANSSKISTLNDLRKKGLITEEEYNRKMGELKWKMWY